eukprot:CAMPEP_0180733960 /NCGR_PEP_ID=MMETSP1038_2-20121128/22457_1 /TAXON_ID=632150 /ORGANISM="Azadinium spinosum, Strain 3D9" /LENGTH=545 /DNA_ID=CAMNT_0022766873 /DNA_START=49 /DNA_END=1684 /DNA_ORIENTATION=-
MTIGLLSCSALWAIGDLGNASGDDCSHEQFLADDEHGDNVHREQVEEIRGVGIADEASAVNSASDDSQSHSEENQSISSHNGLSVSGSSHRGGIVASPLPAPVPSPPPGRPRLRSSTVTTRGSQVRKIGDRKSVGAAGAADAEGAADAGHAQRRNLLPDVPCPDLVPFVEFDSGLPEFAVMMQEEAAATRKPQLLRARAYYRNRLAHGPTSYEALVNLACCHVVLGQNHLALPLLEKAVKRSPQRASAHVNEVLCRLRLEDPAGTLAAVARTLDLAAELSEEQQLCLLRCKASVSPESAELPGMPVRRARTGTVDLAKGGTLDAKVFADMRQELGSLKSYPEESTILAPLWGRCHVFSGDAHGSAGAEAGGGQRWQPLGSDQLAVLRRELRRGLPREDHGGLQPKGSIAEGAEEKIVKFEEEQLRRRPHPGSAQVAYEAAQSLSFLQRLEPLRAVALLESSELVELAVGEYIIRQGDVPDYMYIIASGSVSIESTLEQYGQFPVIIDCFYDGQSFGEFTVTSSGEVSLRRASVKAQEPCLLLRVR